MSVNRDPDEVRSWPGFRFSEPVCALALLAACAHAGRDLGTFGLRPEVHGRLCADDLREHVEVILERGAFLPSQVALQDWLDTREELDLARRALPQAVALGIAEAGCVAACDEGVARAYAFEPRVDAADADIDEPVGEIWPDIAPRRPLRATRYRMNDIFERALEGALSSDDVALSVEAIEALLRPDVLGLFEAASRDRTAEGAAAADRDDTLLDALAIREMAGELFALAGDPALLAAIERVDAALDDTRRQNALFAISSERWWSAEPRAPSPDHWWGVRTWAEENGTALVQRYVGRQTTAPGLAPVIPIERARARLGSSWAGAAASWRRLEPAAPPARIAASDRAVAGSNFVWRPIEGSWKAVLGRLSTDDATWQLAVIGVSAATRVVLCDIERRLTGRRATFSYEELIAAIARVEYGMGVLAVEIDGEWHIALLPEPEER